MNPEQTQEVLDLAPETAGQLETGIETVPVSSLEIPEEPLEPKETNDLPNALTESEKTPETTHEMNAEKSPEKPTEPEKHLEKPTADKSPEKASDPVTECYTQPDDSENMDLEQQPMLEKTPEPLPSDEPLAVSNADGMPEKSGEPVPEVSQAIPEPVTRTQIEEVQQPCQSNEAPEQPEKQADVQTNVEPDVQSESEIVEEVEEEAEAVKVEPETLANISKEAEAVEPTDVEEVTAVVPPLKQLAEAQTLDEVVTEKPVESETLKDVAAEKPVESETVNESEGEKPAEADAVDEDVVVVESAAEGGDEKVEQVELVKEDDPDPAPGSLSFAILEQEQTMATLRTSRTLVILKGLPGSGKSLLARAIADNYKDLCTVFSADDHGVKPESPEASTDAYKALDEAVVEFLSTGTAASMVVVDDTNHTHGRLARLGELAEQHRLVAMFLEPRTEWSKDVPQLAKKSRRGLEEAQIKAMKDPIEETALPLFFGWFLLPGIQDKVRCTSMDFLKTLDTLEAFQKNLIDFTGEAGKEVDLEQYFQTKGDLHCTTKFCDYGKADGAKEYAEMPAVKESYGSVTELSLSALFVTPRTVGARVSLSADQLVLWPAETEKDAGESDVPPASPLPVGSRAHITLGCAEGVQPVQTGLDLLEILALQQEGQQGELVEEMELGSLAYYGEGRWLLSLREPLPAQACFSSRYHPKKEDQVKKESEKKKKQKCTIL